MTIFLFGISIRQKFACQKGHEKKEEVKETLRL